MNNTFIWTFFSVFFQVLLGLVAALLLQQITYGQRLFQVLIMLPWIIPGIAGALVWRWLYHSDFGVISYFTQMLGFTFSWTGDPKFSLPAVIIVNVWKMYPFAMIMIQAGLKAIPKNLFEAARLDGAGGFRVFYSITLPQLQAVLSVLTLLLIIWAFNSFTFIYQITAGGPARSSEILGLKIYHDALRNMMFGRAAAQAIVLFIMMFIFSVVYMKITYKKEN
jgi:multiple sugar transport system permease protein